MIRIVLVYVRQRKRPKCVLSHSQKGTALKHSNSNGGLMPSQEKC